MSDQPQPIFDGADAGRYVDKAEDAAQGYAQDNPDQARAAIDRVEDLIDERTGGKFSGMVDQAGDWVERQLNLPEETPPAPAPEPGTPAPEPETAPDKAPETTPAPEPETAPETTPAPEPETAPAPEPETTPAPEPAPETAPETTPAPEPETEPDGTGPQLDDSGPAGAR